tara:strand:- start:325 stop:576 length:252 start_codon:yes stop_codon:yes gene_type:complete
MGKKVTNQEERYIITSSTRFVGKFSVYDTISGEETPCHNLATARTIVKDKNENCIKQGSGACECCRCDPCDCDGATEDIDPRA